MRLYERDNGARVVDKRQSWEARVEMAVFKLPKSELSVYDKLVYAVLCGHANRDGDAMLYVRTIAAEASCSERQAQRALSNLEACRLLLRRPQIVRGRQTFNIYEVYGFDAYTFPGTRAPESEAEPEQAEPELEATETVSPMTDSHRVQNSRPRGTDTLGTSHRRTEGVYLTRQYNVLEQPLKNSLKKNTPPTPPEREWRGEGKIQEPPKIQKLRNKNGTGGEDKDPKTQEDPKTQVNLQANPESPGYSIFREIAGIYDAILPELPKAGRLTASRLREIEARVRDNPERKELDWWRRYFSCVREFPWPMGDNPNGWRADFDWLVSERGTRKIIEGRFQRQPKLGPGRGTKEDYELQKKYSNANGVVVDVWGLLDELRERKRVTGTLLGPGSGKKEGYGLQRKYTNEDGVVDGRGLLDELRERKRKRAAGAF